MQSTSGKSEPPPSKSSLLRKEDHFEFQNINSSYFAQDPNLVLSHKDQYKSNGRLLIPEDENV